MTVTSPVNGTVISQYVECNTTSTEKCGTGTLLWEWKRRVLGVIVKLTLLFFSLLSNDESCIWSLCLKNNTFLIKNYRLFYR